MLQEDTTASAGISSLLDDLIRTDGGTSACVLCHLSFHSTNMFLIKVLSILSLSTGAREREGRRQTYL